jgi:hypothetical protein
MDYNYLIETKNEFLNTVINILTPQIYNGLITMYEHSMNVFIHLKNKIEKNPKNISSQIVNYFNLRTNDFSKMTVDEIENEYQKIKIDIFKKYVNDIASKNNTEIEGEYLRIKSESRFSDIFDSLIRACFKSYLLFFTFDPKTKNSKFNSEKYYENINIRDFIHKCYVETCTFFLNNPELFIKRNRKTEINEHIKTCIIMSIRKSLPYNDMINEYLRIDFDMKQNKSEDLQKMEKLVNNIMDKNKSKYIFNEKNEDTENINEKNNEKYLKIDKIINENKNKKIILSDNENINEKTQKDIVLEKYETTSINYSDKEKQNDKVEVITDNDSESVSNSSTSVDEDNSNITSINEDNGKSDNESNNESNNESDNESDNESNKNNNLSDTNDIKKSQSVITSLMSLPKRTGRISKIKNNIDKNMEKFYNDLII